MRYKGFLISAFEQEPGKWRARIVRRHGGLLKSTRRRSREFVTSGELSSAVEALTCAMKAIDAGYFSRNAEKVTDNPAGVETPPSFRGSHEEANLQARVTIDRLRRPQPRRGQSLTRDASSK